MAALEEVACRQYAELVTTYIEGELSSERASQFEQHQMVCEHCALYLEQIHHTMQFLRGADDRATQEQQREGVPVSSVPAYKFLTNGCVGQFSGFQWDPGVWVHASGPPRPCARGIHACHVEDLPLWLMPELWRIELSEPVRRYGNKLVAAAGRLTKRVGAWDESAARGFAEDCAARVRNRAVAALKDAGRHEDADRVAALQLEDLGKGCSALAEEPGSTRAKCAYAAEAGDCLAAPPFDAAIGAGYVASLAAAQAGGKAGQTDERRRQVDWLARELQLG